VRPLSYDAIVRVSFAAVLLYLLAGIGTLGLALAYDFAKAYQVAVTVCGGVVSILFAVNLAVLLITMSPTRIRSAFPYLAISGVFLPGFIITTSLLVSTGRVDAVVVLYLESPIFAFYLFRRWLATVAVCLVVAQYGVVIVVQHPDAVGFWLWFIFTSTVAGTSVLISGIATRAEDLSASEHAAREQLAEVNATLERRVNEQVEELATLGEMRRFVSSQVADVIASAGAQELLRPHRRRIAAFFCDLRGFTAFTNGAEPEEVVRVLDEYYGTVGAVLRERGATIGGYAGDGIMAYFGDPVPTEQPALDALMMASDLRPAMDSLIASWHHRGHDLGYGAGIAYGYATLGVVGFDGRFDYTPLGAVVNLAARLCSRAQPGEILLDHATQVAAGGVFVCTEVPAVELKGFNVPQRAFALNSTAFPQTPLEALKGRRSEVAPPGP
jgi:adenylate cyclase